MYWANFIHLYQPYGQSKLILEAVANQSYRRIFNGLKNLSSFKLNLNINAALTEMLAAGGYQDIIKIIKELAQKKKLEFTESAKYHAFLPFLSEQEIERQIIINRQTNKKFFGAAYAPTCFFPPEMAYVKKVARVASRLGYKTIILDEISCPDQNKISYQSTPLIGKTGIRAVFRERRISNLIMSAVIRDADSYLKALGNEIQKHRYLLTAMDGETFGHHRPGLENFLFSIMKSKIPEQRFISEMPGLFPQKPEAIVNPREATWASSEENLKKGVQFFSWKNPENRIHRLQWNFLSLLLKNLEAARSIPPAKRAKVDRALSSDQFFWASAEPWWSIEMIERGAWLTLDALNNLPGISQKTRETAGEFYHRILAEAFLWQRSGKIDSLSKNYREAIKIPFKERTAERNKPEVFEAAIEMMRKKMEEAAQKRDFEKAILWRDAIWKLETKNDVYDTIHAVDLLRQEIPAGELENLMNEYREKYEKLRSGQPELRGVRNKKF